MKKIVLTLVTLLSVIVSAGAQETIPAYRSKGYKANVSYTNIGLLWNAIETSHGYMFNEKFYVGGGAGVFVGALGKAVCAGRIFAEAQAYWFPRKSTLTSGLRFSAFPFFGEGGAFQVFLADLTVGWSWGLANGKGITLNAGVCACYPGSISYVGVDLLPGSLGLTPELSVSFEF